ncbi:hypothetical protein PoB_001249900 [Plakobranchus ocellatus]|uniref:Uncharacterized protein n=1 Tax=Plakobranchus ocellatus TaxID=259542 RepID=A0AAV3YSG3_9GAST|nr:hypothetical protein PoB_001249900 [Plakobranchus ocellatus]
MSFDWYGLFIVATCKSGHGVDNRDSASTDRSPSINSRHNFTFLLTSLLHSKRSQAVGSRDPVKPGPRWRARNCTRRVTADTKAGSLAIVPPMPLQCRWISI